MSAFGCAFGDEDRFLLLANPTPHAVTFALPEGGPWDVVVDTSREEEISLRLSRAAECVVGAHSLVVMKESRA